jgi:hypothetical protein
VLCAGGPSAQTARFRLDVHPRTVIIIPMNNSFRTVRQVRNRRCGPEKDLAKLPFKKESRSSPPTHHEHEAQWEISVVKSLRFRINK